MDPVLPHRALSPGTRNPRAIPQRKKESKLSLKSRQPQKENKENEPPTSITSKRRMVPIPSFRYVDSDLMTSDESDSDIADDVPPSKHNSIMSFNTQESTYSLPIAESTRCELPAKQPLWTTESTVASLHTAEERSQESREKSSSEDTTYYTAYPFPGACNESVVCISDSSPESVKKSAKQTRPHESVLITSDESDSEEQQFLRREVKLEVGQSKPRKVHDTVILETSSSDISDIVRGSDCGVVIPPSMKGSSSSLASSVNQNSDLGLHAGCDIVIPPSPEKYSETSENDSLLSEDRSPVKSFLRVKSKGKCNSTGKPQVYSKNVQHVRVPQKEDSFQFSGKFLVPELNESSWKDDFRLVMPESSVCSVEQSNSKAEPPHQTVSNISKEKYNDIARWLFSGKGGSGSQSTDADACSQVDQEKKEETSTSNISSLKHPQVHRLSIVRRSSFGSESDDNFNALMDSMRKKRESRKMRLSPKDDSFINDSFIDDCASDVAESPSFNIYHSDITKSIRAEVKSVKKSVKKKQFFRRLYDSDKGSDDESGESPVGRREESSKTKFVKRMQLYASDTEGSDDQSDPKSAGVQGSLRIPSTYPDSEDSTSERLDSASKTPSDHSGKAVKPRRNLKGSRTLSSSNSGSEKSVEPQTRRWRKNVYNGDSSSSTSSDVSAGPPKVVQKKDLPRQTKGSSTADLKAISKKIAVLKSPHTPRSPIRTFLSSLSGPTRDPSLRDHPEATPYKGNFKAKKEELTKRLYKLFNREVFERRLPEDMMLEWNARLVRTAGMCYCKLSRKGGVTTRTAKIALSTKVITSPDRLRDTLIHEMCHAAVWLLNNISGGHGPFWKAWAAKAMKRFPELPPIERCHTYKIETKFTYKCTKCGYSFGRHSKSLDLNRKRCGYCYGTFEVFLTSKGEGSLQNAPKTPKAPSAFALFVKENYGLLKKENGNLKHGDIMKKLGEKFTSMKVQQS
ncbi:hypothetical protein ONE63_006619 [Megalurothrips usitatus]|uniref:SprT-like domain-containing protein n=1 Tax=Megalurothrips usitatus TaxID=439358 RepID=A0AAV7XY47_9NEOP|nr:hypothetical protein ONE63_006619 [Megalurothrips usitatus]